MLTMNDIRMRFLDFFKARNHEVVRSSSLVPRDDPSLLFTNAGMVQFKQIFQGLEKSSYPRATTSQKCLRVGGKHNDLENVGRTARHHTFFEMLGNFSFGEYFKEDAIKFAWEFVTKELNLPTDKLYASVYLDDDEAYDLWLKLTDIPAERMLRLGDEDNFWSMGDTGPCGPCSELYIDQGEHLGCGPNCGIGKCDCDRFLEIWNLVFMQYNQIAPGNREKLAKPAIDTGMGLERVTAVCQGVFSNYDTDLFQNIIYYTAELGKVTYSHSMPDTNDIDTALRVIADHSRSIAFMIADGIMPSNEGRGYVLRRLIRRAYRFGTLINMPPAFLYLTTQKVVELMGDSFPELGESAEFMTRLVKEEEERFEKTLGKGLVLLEEEIAQLQVKGTTIIPGKTAFKLYDTYGFPLDIVNDICSKYGFTVDEDNFKEAMAEQKSRAKAAWKGSGEIDLAARFSALLEDGLSSKFIGYEESSYSSRVTALLGSDGEAVTALTKGDTGYLVAGITPFYGASGGQEGDTGVIFGPHGAAIVTDTLKVSEHLTVHVVTIGQGELLLDQEITLEIDTEPRLDSARNHTVTHLLHAALRNVLGTHVHQAGSLVSANRLRFDFTHMTAMTDEEIRTVEKQVNAAIMANYPICVTEKSYDDAIKAGAIALFGEKYTDTVRVVQMETESTELCGGTHLQSTGQAGSFIIISESGVAANTRRIEAATGWHALQYTREQQQELSAVYGLLKCRAGESPVKIRDLQKELRDTRKEITKLSAQAVSGQGKSFLEQQENINGMAVLAVHTEAGSVRALREVMDDMRSKIPSGIICLTTVEKEKVALIVSVSKDLLAKTTAPAIIEKIASAVDGSGGGRPDMAQAGGTNVDGISTAFKELKAYIATL